MQTAHAEHSDRVFPCVRRSSSVPCRCAPYCRRFEHHGRLPMESSTHRRSPSRKTEDRSMVNQPECLIRSRKHEWRVSSCLFSLFSSHKIILFFKKKNHVNNDIIHLTRSNELNVQRNLFEKARRLTIDTIVQFASRSRSSKSVWRDSLSENSWSCSTTIC